MQTCTVLTLDYVVNRERATLSRLRAAKAEFLWKYITRGVIVVIKDKQHGVDIILRVSTYDV